MDGAIPVDAKNAPTGIWKTAQNAVSHTAHTHRLLRMKKNEDPRDRRSPTCPPIRIRSNRKPRSFADEKQVLAPADLQNVAVPVAEPSRGRYVGRSLGP